MYYIKKYSLSYIQNKIFTQIIKKGGGGGLGLTDDTVFMFVYIVKLAIRDKQTNQSALNFDVKF